jgi:hypothetical protein
MLTTNLESSFLPQESCFVPVGVVPVCVCVCVCVCVFTDTEEVSRTLTISFHCDYLLDFRLKDSPTIINPSLTDTLLLLTLWLKPQLFILQEPWEGAMGGVAPPPWWLPSTRGAPADQLLLVSSLSAARMAHSHTFLKSAIPGHQNSDSPGKIEAPALEHSELLLGSGTIFITWTGRSGRQCPFCMVEVHPPPSDQTQPTPVSCLDSVSFCLSRSTPEISSTLPLSPLLSDNAEARVPQRLLPHPPALPLQHFWASLSRTQIPCSCGFMCHHQSALKMHYLVALKILTWFI